jgi:methionyl-tRNA formyltransferase
MASEVDAGPVAYRERIDIGPDDMALTVSAVCARTGLALVERLLRVAAEDPSAIPAQDQDLTRRKWYGRGPAPRRACPMGPLGADGHGLRPRVRLRALHSPWGRATSRARGREVAILRARATGRRAEAMPGTVAAATRAGTPVAAADEWVVVERAAVDGAPAPPSEALREGTKLPATRV